MFNDCYKNKKVLVTGHTGFKGSWLCAWLDKLGAKVIGISDEIPTKPSNFEAGQMDTFVKSYFADICNLSAIREILNKEKPEFVFHLAAQALVRKSYRDPVKTFQTNAIGTMNVLEAARSCDSIKSIVMITSDKAYKNVEWVYGYRETDALGGSDPYSASKGCAELICHSYFDSFYGNEESPVCSTTRAGNVIGGGDWAEDRIVPDCARAWSHGKGVEIRNPFATRPWQLVLEPLSGYLWLGALQYQAFLEGKNSFRNESYNFGPSSDSVHTVKDVVLELSKYWPAFSFELDERHQELKECGLLKLCCDKALNDLSWKAVLTFKETIQFTAEWYKSFYSGSENMRFLINEQIDEYSQMARERGLKWAN